MQILQPPDWAKPKGYSNGIVAKGRLVFVAARSAGTTRRRSSRPAISPAATQALKTSSPYSPKQAPDPSTSAA